MNNILYTSSEIFEILNSNYSVTEGNRISDSNSRYESLINIQFHHVDLYCILIMIFSFLVERTKEYISSFHSEN